MKCDLVLTGRMGHAVHLNSSRNWGKWGKQIFFRHIRLFSQIQESCCSFENRKDTMIYLLKQLIPLSPVWHQFHPSGMSSSEDGYGVNMYSFLQKPCSISNLDHSSQSCTSGLHAGMAQLGYLPI